MLYAAVLGVWDSAGVGPQRSHGVVPAVQADLMGVATPREVTIWTGPVTRDYGPVWVIPLPHISTIPGPTTLCVHLGGDTHEGGARIQVAKVCHANVSDRQC